MQLSDIIINIQVRPYSCKSETRPFILTIQKGGTRDNNLKIQRGTTNLIGTIYRVSSCNKLMSPNSSITD